MWQNQMFSFDGVDFGHDSDGGTSQFSLSLASLDSQDVGLDDGRGADVRRSSLQPLLDQVDHLLYDQTSAPAVQDDAGNASGHQSAHCQLSDDVVEECRQWSQRFTHLRVTGSSVTLHDSTEGVSYGDSRPIDGDSSLDTVQPTSVNDEQPTDISEQNVIESVGDGLAYSPSQRQHSAVNIIASDSISPVIPSYPCHASIAPNSPLSPVFRRPSLSQSLPAVFNASITNPCESRASHETNVCAPEETLQYTDSRCRNAVKTAEFDVSDASQCGLVADMVVNSVVSLLWTDYVNAMEPAIEAMLQAM